MLHSVGPIWLCNINCICDSYIYFLYDCIYICTEDLHYQKCPLTTVGKGKTLRFGHVSWWYITASVWWGDQSKSAEATRVKLLFREHPIHQKAAKHPGEGRGGADRSIDWSSHLVLWLASNWLDLTRVLEWHCFSIKWMAIVHIASNLWNGVAVTVNTILHFILCYTWL